MKISKLALIALLGGALMAFGCSSDDGDGGSSGGGGNGGDTGGGGNGGEGPGPACVPHMGPTCESGEIDPIVPCCELDAPPEVESACTGDESVTNPETCTATGTVVTHQLTLFEIAGNCNVGYDLDACNGQSCLPGGLAPTEGEEGIDNALAGLAPVLEGVGGNLGGVNQAFNDALCGVSDQDDEVEGCETEITPLDLGFAVDANLEEGCANVGLLVDGEEAGSVILNVSAADGNGNVCASGTLGTIPLEIGGTAGAFANAVVSITISEGGFSNGLMGATVDSDTAVAIAEALLAGAGAVVGQTFDINDMLAGDANAACNALSGTYSIGGVVAPEPVEN
jgi:hypothetical protein